MFEYEWENSSHILDEQTPEVPYSDIPTFIPPPFLHQNTFNAFQTVIDPTASYSHAPMLSSADFEFFSNLPKPEPADTPLDGADLDRIGLNLGLGGRTYFSAADESFLNRLYRRSRPFDGVSVAANSPKCQVEGCNADLSLVKHYHRRHKVCEFHSKASTVVAGGLTQRFCQQCSRFHMLTEFDSGKRSCRRRLADHNRRRRKSNQATADKPGNSSASQNPIRSPSESSQVYSVTASPQESKLKRYNSEASPSVSSNSIFY